MPTTTQTFSRGGFQFTVEEYATKRWRTTAVEGPIHATVGSVKGKRKGNQSLCQFETDDADRTVLQFGFAKYAMPPGFDGGHLIALDIGGIENPANVVPMPSFFNRHGLWREQEQFLLQVLSGRSVRLKVEVQYTGASPIPSKLKLTYSYPCPTDEDPSLLSVNTLELAPEVYSRTGYTIPEDIYRQFNDNVSDYCEEFEYTDEHDLPYSFLDWLNEKLDHAIIGSSSIANGAKFTKLQRQYVWSLNCWNNNAGAAGFPRFGHRRRQRPVQGPQHEGMPRVSPGRPHEAGEQGRDERV